MRAPRLGILLVLLQAQFLAAALLSLGAILGGAYFIGFSQVPGGLWDVAASPVTESHARAVALHLLYFAALGLHLLWLRRGHPRMRQAAIAHAALAVLTMPFGTVLGVLAAWHRDADWTDARRYASQVTGRTRISLSLTWAVALALCCLFAFGAYLGVLSGTAWLAVVLLPAAGITQVGTIWLISKYEPKTALRTYGSPLPELPEW